MEEKRGLIAHISYPYNPYYKFESMMERINLDEECEKDLSRGKGHVIGPPQTIDKNLKDPDGIFSIKFGQTLSDANPYIDRYKCDCGELRSQINNNIMCQKCKSRVKYVGDDYKYFGWLKLKEHYVIHPNLFKTIEFIIGADRLDKILFIEDEKDVNGHSSTRGKKRKRKLKTTEMYDGIGMTQFRLNFDEIIEYYYKKRKVEKASHYEDIKKNRDIIFCQSIPVFTVHLRPYQIDNNNKDFSFEYTNSKYTMMTKLVSYLNNNELKIFRKTKPNEQLLYRLQIKFNELYKEIENILATKKGILRQLFGGRYNMSARTVIVQNPELEIDQLTLPYECLVELLQQRIINILRKSYNMTFSEANDLVYNAMLVPNDIVKKVIYSIINSTEHGIPMIINRNPTIARGGSLQMFCIGMTMTYTMAIPLQILNLLAADFDGDILNILIIVNKAFFQRSYELLNPRNSMYISNNDGMTNVNVLPERDNIINANALIRLCRNRYTPEEMNHIKQLQSNRFNDN